MMLCYRVRCCVDLQSFPKAIDEGLEEGFIMRNGLQDIPISCDVTNSPLAKPRTAQSENIAVTKRKCDCYSKHL